MMKMINAKICVASCLLLMSACKSDYDIVNRYPTEESVSEVLQGLADIENAIVTDWAKQTDSFQLSVTEFLTAPSSTTLANMQAKWKQARNPWESNESFGFGPVSNDGIDGNTDDWPVDVNSIKAIVSSNQTLNTSFVSGMVTNTRGFHALEYLIFGSDGTKAVNDFSPRELQLINLLAADLKSQADLLKTRWTPDMANSFYDDFKNGGQENSIYSSTAAALNEVLGAMTDIMTELPDTKMEEPLTKQNVDYLESRFSDYSYYDFRNNINGVRAAYIGTYGNFAVDMSLSNLVNNLNPSLNEKVLTQFKLVLALNDLVQPTSMNQAIFTNQDQLRDLQNELRKLNLMLSNEVPAAIGIGE